MGAGFSTGTAGAKEKAGAKWMSKKTSMKSRMDDDPTAIHVGTPVVIITVPPELMADYSDAVGVSGVVISMLWGQIPRCRIMMPNLTPIIPPVVLEQKHLITIKSAQARGWFWRWEYLHRTGWRHYSLDESSKINDGYMSGRQSLKLAGGGKLGRSYSINFGASVPGVKDPHMAVQVSGSSGVKRAVRRRLFDCSQIGSETSEGWMLRWSEISPNFVVDMHALSHDTGGNEITSEYAKQILDQHVLQKEFSILAGGSLAQICYVLDASGSMQQPIDAAKSTINQLSRDLIKEFNQMRFEFGCVAYRDFDMRSRNILTKSFVPTSRVLEMQTFLGGVYANGGDDIPEDMAGGLQTCLSLPWKPHAVKVVVIIADAPCHEPRYHGYPDGDDKHPTGSSSCGTYRRRPMARLLKETAERGIDLSFFYIGRQQWTALMVSEFKMIYNPLRKSAPMQVFGLEVCTPDMFKDRIKTSVETAVNRSRFMGPHVTKFLEEEGKDPCVVWEWYHGKRGRAWKSYRGAESLLLEQRHAAQAAFALMNGGKSTTVAQPMEVLFNTVWSKDGKVFAFHTQKNLVSKNCRGVRRKVKRSNGRDYIYYRWLKQFPHANAMAVFKVYHKFLTILTEKKTSAPSAADDDNADSDSSEDDDVAWNASASASSSSAKPESFEALYARTKQAALTELKSLETQSLWTAPPQDHVPELFLCGMTSGVMKTPSFSKANPDMRRIERIRFEEYVKSNGFNPLTQEKMAVKDIVVDKELETKMITWMSGFVGKEGTERTDQKATPSSAAAAPAADAELKNKFYFKTAARDDQEFVPLASYSGSHRFVKDLRQLAGLEGGSVAAVSAADINIDIKTLTGELVATLSIKPTATVAAVKLKLQDETGTRANKHQLLFAGKKLEDNCGIDTYGVETESTMHLVPGSSNSSAGVAVHGELPTVLSVSVCAPSGDDDVLASARVSVKFVSETKCPYSNGVFEVEVNFPKDFPLVPPTLNFVTPIYHYAVGFQGTVCLPMLQKDLWTPTFSLVKVFTDLNTIITQPEAIDPSGQMAQRCWLMENFRMNKAQYDAQAEQVAIKFASGELGK